MTVKQCLCKAKIKPGMFVYRHFCGGTIIGEVKRVNERSVRIRKFNGTGTALSDEHVTLKFKPNNNDNGHIWRNEGLSMGCWCVTDVHELTPEVAQEKYFRDKLIGCNPYIAKKIGLTKRMSAPLATATEPPAFFVCNPSHNSVAEPSTERLDEQLASQGAIDVEKDDRAVTDMISAGKYKNKVPYPLGSVQAYRRAGKPIEALVAARNDHHVEEQRVTDMLRHDLELEHGIRRRHPTAARPNLTLLTVPLEKATLLWDKAWEHGHANGYHEVAYWYDDLAGLVKR